MTPQEQQLVAELFDRLASLEGQRRDPDAERVITEGLRRAPNAVYALVQSVLVQDEALKRTPFIMVTGEANTEHVIAARKAGVSNYIVKPFNAQTLKTKIEAVISARTVALPVPT